jgi:hypothetical protein
LKIKPLSRPGKPGFFQLGVRIAVRRGKI